MDAEEIAEKIASIYCKRPHRTHNCGMRKDVATALRFAMDKGSKEVIKGSDVYERLMAWRDVWREISAQARDEGFKNALCKCLKLSQEETTLCRRAQAPENVLSGQVGASSRIAAKIESLLQGDASTLSEYEQIVYAKGRDEGLEEAARVAQDHAKIKGAHIHEGFKFCVEEVANQILSLSKKGV